MRTIETKNLLVGKLELRLGSLVTLIGCLIAFLSAISVSAQTFPTSCTSKDLTLLKASLPAPAGNRCVCSGDRSLVLGIHNGTSSTRTSFALWGTMNVYDQTGTLIGSPHSIFACAGPIGPSGDYYLNATTLIIDGESVPTDQIVGYPIITVSCGESVDIVNMHLAWTSATPGATCTSLQSSPSTINPKCGTQDLIHVDLGVNGSLTTTAATCLTGGTIKVSPFGGLSPYEVSLDGGAYFAVPANPGYYTFTNVTAGGHTVTIRDNTGAAVANRCTTNKTPIVGSSTAPTAAAAGDLITCSHTTASLNGTGSSTGTNITYLWTGSATVTNSSSISGSTTVGGTYTLTVTNTDNGCTSSATASVSVNTTAPTAQAAGDLITCSHITATLSGSASSTGAGISYLWAGAGAVTNSTSVSASTTTGGSYTLKVTDGGNGCTASSAASVSVNTAVPTAHAAGDLITCSHGTASLSGSGSSTGAGISYLWTGSGAVTNSTLISASTTTGGSYTLKVTDGGNGCTASATASVSVNTTAPTFNVSLVQPTLCTQYGSVTITPTVAGSYHFSIDNGTNFTNTTGSFTNLVSGSVTGIKIRSDATGCTSDPLNCGTANLPSETVKTAPINDMVLAQVPTVKAYPNPFNDHVKFVVNAPAAGNGSLDIYNIMGQKVRSVYQGRIVAGNNSFDLIIPKQDQETLIYIFRVGGQKVTGKLLQLNR